MRVRFGVLLAVVGGTLSIGAAGASSAAAQVFDLCKEPGHSCTDVSVPLDWTGVVPGTIKVQIDRRRARRATRPPLVVIAGAPGQSSLLGSVTDSIGTEGRSRDVVVMDLRGTGGSDALRCPALQRGGLRGTAKAAAACARRLGPRRGFYTARDSAQDVEAVRKAIGAERIALLGESYGARVAFAYAGLHPERVDRLVLDTPLSPGGIDPLRRSSFAAVPGVVRARCARGACRQATRTPVADVAALARRVERRTLRGPVLDGAGRRQPTEVTPFDLFYLLDAGGSEAFGGVDDRSLPGLFRNARQGDLLPLLRARHGLDALDSILAAPGFTSLLSLGAYAASTCEESSLPWSRSALIETRRAVASAFVRGMAPSAFAPFGPRAALGSDVLELCERWPIASRPPAPVVPLPPLPTLVLAPVNDLSASIGDGEVLSRLIPGSRLLRLPGADNSVGYPEARSCAARAIRRFLAGGQPDECRRPRRPRRAFSAPPMSLRDVSPVAGTRGKAGRTLAAVRMTLRDGVVRFPGAAIKRAYDLSLRRGGNWGSAALRPLRVGGLRNGSLSLSLTSGRLVVRGASYVPGVRIEGFINHFIDEHRDRRSGFIHVSGPSAVRGTLVVRRHVLRGWLGGRYLTARLSGPPFTSYTFSASKATSPEALVSGVLSSRLVP